MLHGKQTFHVIFILYCVLCTKLGHCSGLFNKAFVFVIQNALIY